MKAILISLPLLVLATTASAEDGLVIGSGRDTGVTFGVGGGIGHITCEGADCGGVNTSGGLMLHVGGLLNPSVALLADAWGMLHKEDRATFSQGIFTGAVRWWPIERFWVGAGLGVAVARWSYDAGSVDLVSRTAFVPAAAAMAGIELISSPTFSLDFEARFGAGFYEDNDVQVRNAMIGFSANFF